MTSSQLNQVTATLAPYPMEELTRIRQGLVKAGKPVFDFGTGDPKIPTWSPIRDAIVNAIPKISQYPSVRGKEDLREAQLGYLERRFGIRRGPEWSVIPTQGSKEAIFNIGLCIVGRSGGKRHVIYPDPGYPVYRSSTQFAGGIPVPVRITEKNGYLLEPWNLPKEIQANAAGIWINYPHNPTGATATPAYFRELIDWCHRTDTLLLSDDCYIDIYDASIDARDPENREGLRPTCPLQFSTDRVLTFMSLSKRSGLTGYRSGLLAGDRRIIEPLVNARANFGVGSPDFVQAGATVAWADETHVAERRKIFTHRIAMFAPTLQRLGMLTSVPTAAFYLWCKIPESFGDDDVKFVLALAEKGVIASPSQWLSEGVRGHVRFALVPDDEPAKTALGIIENFVRTKI